MKKLLSILLIITMLLSMVGCSTTTNFQNVNEENSIVLNPSLEYIGGKEGFEYYRDTITDVMYLSIYGAYQGAITEMSDPVTGLPLTFVKYTELYMNTLETTSTY